MKIKKVAIIILILIVTLLGFVSNVNATIDPNDFTPPGDMVGVDSYTIAKKGATILNIIVTVGVVISVVMFMILGIKYMLGSIEEKAEYKKTMIPMIIGTGLLFTATTIVGIIGNVVAHLE